jgi:hypothetical protein
MKIWLSCYTAIYLNTKTAYDSSKQYNLLDLLKNSNEFASNPIV